MRAGEPEADHAEIVLGSTDRLLLEARIRHYQSQCACGVAAVTGVAFAAILLCAFVSGGIAVPGSGWRIAASFIAAIVGGNAAGKLGGLLYFRTRAARLKRRLSAR